MIRYLAAAVIALATPLAAGSWGVATIDIGGGQAINAPVPEGFSALGNSDPSFHAFLARANPPKYRLLDVFLAPEDFLSLRNGQNPARDRMLSIDMVAPDQGDVWTEAAFRKYVGVIRGMDKTHPTQVAEAIKDFYSKRRESEPSLPRADTPKYLGLVVDQPKAVGVLRGANVDSPRGMEQQIFSNIYVYVKGRMFVLNLNAHVHGEEDTKWMLETSRAWTEKLLSEN